MIVPQKARRNTPISQPVGNIFKICIWAGVYWSEMTPPSKNCYALPQRLKNYPELGETDRFLFFLYEAPWVLGRGVISLCRIVANMQDYNST